MCHQNFFLPKSGVGHVSWLIAYLIKRVLQQGPVTLLLREHEVEAPKANLTPQSLACCSRDFCKRFKGRRILLCDRFELSTDRELGRVKK